MLGYRWTTFQADSNHMAWQIIHIMHKLK